MKARYAVPLFLLLVVIAAIALAPASLVDTTLRSATTGRLHLTDAAGTVWRGRGALTDASGTWQTPIAWRASPLAVLRGGIDVELSPQGRIVANGGVELRDLRVALPAVALGSALPAVPAIDLGGEVTLDAPLFRYDGRSGDGALALRWERARAVVNGTLVDLGNVTARVTPQGDGLAGVLANEGGVLRVAGNVALSNEKIVADAILTPAPGLPPAIAQALAALGPADASGAVRVSWRGAAK
ncbi:MAG TPA: type II secretion system protein N [Casimicrobiaceae bacterium]|nr:type II secretion system protein N [Casimicrobiaceae bacterium]